MKKKVLILLGALIFLAALVTILKYTLATPKLAELEENHLLVSTSGKQYSEFDHFLLDEVGLNWVPSYLVIENKQIIGVIRGGLSSIDTKDALNTLLMANNRIDLPEHTTVFVVDKDNIFELKDLLTDKLTLVEVHMHGCKDCDFVDGVPGEYQVEVDGEVQTVQIKPNVLSSTELIRFTVDADFFRYYIKTELDDIK
jgi:hypothetical protein